MGRGFPFGGGVGYEVEGAGMCHGSVVHTVGVRTARSKLGGRAMWRGTEKERVEHVTPSAVGAYCKWDEDFVGVE